MNNANWATAIIVGLPEEFFYILTIAFLVGRRDIINFRSLNKVLRIIGATVLTDLCIFLMRQYSDSILLNFLVQLAFFTIVYIIVLGIEWYESTIGILITFVTFLILEFISVMIMVPLTGKSVAELQSTLLLVFLAVLPSRLLQILLVWFLSRMKRPLLNLGRLGKLSARLFRNLALIHAYLFVAFLQIIFTVKYFVFDHMIEDSLKQPFFWLNVSFTIIMAIILIVVINTLSKILSFEKQEKIVWLMWFRKLLDEYGYKENSDIKKIVEDAIYETGRDNREE